MNTCTVDISISKTTDPFLAQLLSSVDRDRAVILVALAEIGTRAKKLPGFDLGGYRSVWSQFLDRESKAIPSGSVGFRLRRCYVNTYDHPFLYQFLDGLDAKTHSGSIKSLAAHAIHLFETQTKLDEPANISTIKVENLKLKKQTKSESPRVS